jgi:sensor domain CHASE-containing protein
MKTVTEAASAVAVARTGLTRAKAVLATALADLADARDERDRQAIEVNAKYVETAMAHARGQFQKVVDRCERNLQPQPEREPLP